MSAYRPSGAVTLRAIAVCAILGYVPIVSTCFNEKFTCRSVFEEHIRNVGRITDRNSAIADHLQTCAVFNKKHSIDLRIRISIHGNRITVEIQRDRFTLDQSQNVLTILGVNDIFLGKRNVAHKNECFAILRIVNCRLERGIIFTRDVILNAFFHTFVFAVFVEYDHIIIVVRNRHRVCYNCACVKRLAVLTNFSGYSHFSALVKNDLSALFDIKGSVHGYFGTFSNRKCRAVRNRQLLSVQIKACAVKRHLSRSRISLKYSIGKKRNCLVFICSGRSIGKRIVHDRSVCIVNLRLRLCQIYYGIGISRFCNTCLYLDFFKIGIFKGRVDRKCLWFVVLINHCGRSYVNGGACIHTKINTRSLYHKSNAEVIGTHILFGRNECIRDSHIACGANICTVKRIRNRRILDREFRTIAIIHDTVNNGKIATVNRDFGSDSTRNVNTRNVGSQFRSAVGMFNKLQIAAGKRYFCGIAKHVNATLLVILISTGILLNGKIFDFYAAVNVNVDGASSLGGKRFAVTVKCDFFVNRDRRSCFTLFIRTEGNILEQCHRIARSCSVNGVLQGGISHVADFGNVIRRNFCCCAKGQKHSNHPCKKHSKNHFCVILFHKNLSFNKFFHIKLHRSMWQYLCMLIYNIVGVTKVLQTSL